MIAFGKLQLIKVVITQLGDYWIIPISKNIIQLIAVDLSKQLDADPKTMQQINFTRNIAWDGNTTMFFIIEEMKETVSNFSKVTMRVL